MVTMRQLIRRSLVFHWRAHLGVVLGAAVGGAALIGALIVGDSVRASLREMALARLGRVYLALDAGDRMFGAGLAEKIRIQEKSDTVPLLMLPGMASVPNQEARANRIQVIGINEKFGELANEPPPFEQVARDSVVLNQALADQLQVTNSGATVILRFKKPSALAREATLATKSDAEVAWRVNVSAILSDAQLGRFSLRANQAAAYNAFVNLAQMQELTQQNNRANLLVISRWNELLMHKAAGAEVANAELARQWRLTDAELELVERPAQNAVELRTSRIFLDAPVVKAALAGAEKGQGILTYLVNQFRAGDRTTPYSMVAALESPLLPADLRDDEIVLSQWLADDLKIDPGAKLELAYYLLDAGTQLIERTNAFTVRAVVPLDSPLADRTLMPEFPGIATAESTREWDAGFPLVHTIRPKDDDYWKQHRGTPKGFITLAAGQKLWGNRYGDLTAIRFPVPNGTSARILATRIEERILAGVPPARLGLRFEPVRQQALQAASQSQDFGGLFIGFSFFLILAALILTALLFRFGLEQRVSEAGTLLALGFLPKQVRRIFLLEGAALALVGSLIGLAGGIAYARAMLYGLTTIWSSATGVSSLSYHAAPTSLVGGLVGSVLVAVFSLWLVLRKIGRQPVRALLASELGAPVAPLSRGPWISALILAGALGLVGWAIGAGELTNPGIFFGGGTLLLMGALGLTRWLLGRWGRQPAGDPTGVGLSLLSLGFRGTVRRRGRSLATVSLLACGSFIIASIGVFKLDANRDASKRSSGTGGFALIGEASLPVLRDLNLPEGRDLYGLSEAELAGVSLVPMRVKDGDDASCLNLNRAQKPRVLGVMPELMMQREAFTFAGVIKGADPKQAWSLLERATAAQYLKDLGPDEVPAIGDAASIQWALGLKIGGSLAYTDERGNTFKLRIVGGVANSILQGSLLIDEAEFTRRFPNESGHRMFLIDAPSNRVTEVSGVLTRALRNLGLEVTPAARRLAQFNAVQNTYLNTFQVLGGLGLLLGTAGLGVVVLRNLLERRSELALLLAVGFRRRLLSRLVLLEHSVLLVLGLGIGVAAALVAVSPALLSPGSEIPYRSLGLTLGAVFASGLAWTWLAALAALRGDLLPALRNE